MNNSIDSIVIYLVGILAALVVVMLVAIPSLIVLGVSGFGTPISESTYTGQVVDVENDKGIIWKVDTAYARTGDDSSTTEEFCIQDEELMEKANRHADSGKRIVMTYERPLWLAPWECKSGTSIVTDMEVAGEQQ